MHFEETISPESLRLARCQLWGARSQTAKGEGPRQWLAFEPSLPQRRNVSVRAYFYDVGPVRSDGVSLLLATALDVGTRRQFSHAR